MLNYSSYLRDVIKWECSLAHEGDIRELIFPLTSLGDAVRIANFLRNHRYNVEVKKISRSFQEIIITKSNK